MVQPHGTLPHDDHFHVRIACPGGHAGCIENPAVHIARRGHGHTRGHASATITHAARTPRLRARRRSLANKNHGAEPRSREEVVADPAAAMVETIDGDGG